MSGVLKETRTLMNRLAAIAICIAFGYAAASAQNADVIGQPRATGITVVAKLPEQPMEIARTPDGRIFTVLYSSVNDKSRLVEVLPNGDVRDYPSAAWNAGRKPDGTGFSEVIGLKAGENGWLGIIDAGDTRYAPRVIVWDPKTNAAVKVREISDVRRRPRTQVFTQDLAIDVPHKCVYTVAAANDRKSATLIVVDLNSNTMRTFTILNARTPENAAPADKTEVADTASLRNGLNLPIAIDPAGKWVYLGGMAGTEIYRIPSATLADPQLTSDALLKNLVIYGKKKMCTNMAADNQGNVYCAGDATNKIDIFCPGAPYRTFLQDSILNYPYGLALGKDGYLYISVNQIPRLGYSKSTVDQAHPYLIVRARQKL